MFNGSQRKQCKNVIPTGCRSSWTWTSLVCAIFFFHCFSSHGLPSPKAGNAREAPTHTNQLPQVQVIRPIHTCTAPIPTRLADYAAPIHSGMSFRERLHTWFGIHTHYFKCILPASGDKTFLYPMHTFRYILLACWQLTQNPMTSQAMVTHSTHCDKWI